MSHPHDHQFWEGASGSRVSDDENVEAQPDKFIIRRPGKIQQSSHPHNRQFGEGASDSQVSESENVQPQTDEFVIKRPGKLQHNPHPYDHQFWSSGSRACKGENVQPQPGGYFIRRPGRIQPNPRPRYNQFWEGPSGIRTSDSENVQSQPGEFNIRRPAKFQQNPKTHRYAYRTKNTVDTVASNNGGNRTRNSGSTSSDRRDEKGEGNQRDEFLFDWKRQEQTPTGGLDKINPLTRIPHRSIWTPSLTNENNNLFSPRPGTVGAQQGYRPKPNVYRSDTHGTNDMWFTPSLPLQVAMETPEDDRSRNLETLAQAKANLQKTLETRGFIHENLNVRARFSQQNLPSDSSSHDGLNDHNHRTTPTSEDKLNFQNPLSSTLLSIAKYLHPPNLIPNMKYDRDRDPKLCILLSCGQLSSIPINILFENLKQIKKVGEGVYGEVYLGNFLNVPFPSVYKIVPIEGQELLNGEKQKRFEEIHPEIIVSKRLNTLRDPTSNNFTEGYGHLRHVRVCHGEYPNICLQAWRFWDDENHSENEYPDSFNEEQNYIVFEYEFGGVDVECFKFRNAQQAFSLLFQVVYTLSVGESGVEFEHRDLHWGNILVSPTHENQIKYILRGKEFMVNSFGIKSTIIDFTISRVIGEDKRSIFTDLANDPGQFVGNEDYQFEIYRMMKRLNRNNWNIFQPRSNIYWCHYLVGKLVNGAHYLDKSSSVHKFYIKKLEKFQNIILQYLSCSSFALNVPKDFNEKPPGSNK